MEALTLLDFAIVIAGAAVGVLAMVVAATLVVARRTPLAGERRERTLVSLIEQAEQVLSDPGNTDSAERLRSHLSELQPTAQNIEIVTHLLSLGGPDNPVRTIINDCEQVRGWLVFDSASSVTHCVAALELITALDDTATLPTVLVASSHEAPEVRRAALRTMASLAPVQSIGLYARTIPDEGPWVVERLAGVVRRPGVIAGFLAYYGEAELTEIIGLLAELLVDADERRALAAIDILGTIDHPAATSALRRTSRASEPMLSIAAVDVLAVLAEPDVLRVS